MKLDRINDELSILQHPKCYATPDRCGTLCIVQSFCESLIVEKEQETMFYNLNLVERAILMAMSRENIGTSDEFTLAKDLCEYEESSVVDRRDTPSCLQ